MCPSVNLLGFDFYIARIRWDMRKTRWQCYKSSSWLVPNLAAHSIRNMNATMPCADVLCRAAQAVSWQPNHCLLLVLLVQEACMLFDSQYRQKAYFKYPGYTGNPSTMTLLVLDRNFNGVFSSLWDRKFVHLSVNKPPMFDSFCFIFDTLAVEQFPMAYCSKRKKRLNRES